MKINKRVIAGIGCKDEEWIIKKTLTALTKFCFKIIIVDDGSTDKTEEICKSFVKVDFHKRKSHDWRIREDGRQRQEIIDYMKPYKPDYCLFLDADEIPSPDIVKFINNIDLKVNLWKLPWVHLWGDKNHYRVDKYKSSVGPVITWDPYNGGQRKSFLMKFDSNIKYKYPLNQHLSVKMAPYNTPEPYRTTEDTRVLHWGKISKYFKSGKKDEDYAKMKAFTNKTINLKQRINHHKSCRSERTLKLKPIDKSWHWE